MSKYYQVNIYADTPSYEHRKMFGVLIKDETPVDYFVRFNENFGPEHVVNYTLVNWFELTEEEYDKMKLFESVREKPETPEKK